MGFVWSMCALSEAATLSEQLDKPLHASSAAGTTIRTMRIAAATAALSGQPMDLSLRLGLYVPQGNELGSL